MDSCDENNPAVMKRMNYGSNAMEGAKFTTKIGNNRRVLGDINNFVAKAPFPSAVTKRGISEKPCIEDKNKHTLGHRPITRRFAASLASKQPCKEDPSVRVKVFENEKHKKTIALASNSNGSESHTVTDLAEDMEVSDCSLPIHVKQKDTAHCPLPLHPKQTSAMVEEIEPMNNPELEEVEMEDLEEVEPIPDVDSLDKKNSLAVVEYVEDIYSFYRQTEVSSCVHPNYMCNQPDINEKMRAILIDWLIEVHYKFELMDETLFLTVNIIDRFLERESIVRKKLQLVGVTAMLLACKYEEVSVPVVEDLILISDRAYTREEILAMEKLMTNTLKFCMSVPTPYVFMRRFLKVAQSDKKIELLSFFMIELCLVEYDMLKYSPSLLAAAAVYTAKCTLQGYRNWSRASEWHSKYTEDQLLECSRLMVDFHQKAASGKLTGVHRKYNTFKFGYAARAAPARFLSDTRN